MQAVAERLIECAAMQVELSERDVVQMSSMQTSCALEGETIILNLKDSTYYHLDGVGARIWELVQEPKIVGELIHVLLSEYNVSPHVCAEQLREFLDTLKNKGLIDVRHAPSP